MPIYKHQSAEPSRLALLQLPSPLILFPSCRVTLSVPREVSAGIVELLRSAGDTDQPLLAAVPLPPLRAVKDGSPPSSHDTHRLHNWGTTAKLVRLVRSSDVSDLLTLQGLARVMIPDPPSTPLDPLPVHAVRIAKDVEAEVDPSLWEAFKKAAIAVVARMEQEAAAVGPTGSVTVQAWGKLGRMVKEVGVERAGWIVDVVVGTVGGDYEDRLRLLECVDVSERVKCAAEMLSKRNSISELKTKIATSVTTSLTNAQKAFYLRQQLQAIQRELSALSSPSSPPSNGPPPPYPSSDGEQSELDADADGEEEMADIKKKIELLVKGSEERKAAVREWRRLKRIPPGSVETGVIRGYLEWLTALPWPTDDASVQSREKDALLDPGFLSNAKATLERDHYGLEKIKRRLTEYLVVLRLRALSTPPSPIAAADVPSTSAATPADPPLATASPPQSPIKAPILLLVGPPGTGKTSIAASLARSLRRPFERISLGGVRDEASIRGHRRTYVASGPGMIISALRRAGQRDCVMLLDEMDKLAGRGGVMGDPAAALLEVLDPEQNVRFVDHYLGIPFDLSQVTWIATANTLDGMSEPLLDRCEIIHLSGYTYTEKLHIARNYLLPKQLQQNAMPADKVVLPDPTIRAIATLHTREAGVRSLERQIGAVVRHKAVELSEESGAGKDSQYRPEVLEADLEKILGLGRWDPKEMERKERAGVVWGLVFTGEGEGEVLCVETVKVPGEGRLRLTGSLGDVIRESGEIALSWVKSHAHTLGITATLSHDPLKHPDPIDIHLHLPAGATRKDGPSAGVAMVCAFVSLLTGRTVPTHIAMTGELTLRGSVTAVGGIKEKVLGAHRAGITKVIMPARNKRDVDQDIPLEVRREMEFTYVENVEDALDAAFGAGVFVAGAGFVESRL